MAITTLENGYVLVPRADWGASRKITGANQKRGTKTVYIHHSAMRELRDPCASFKKLDQVLDNRGLKGYNYAVHSSGVVGEIAGNKQGEHTRGQNSVSMAICLTGNFDTDQPTMAALLGAARTINLLRWVGLLHRDVEIRGHRDAVATACPGANIYEKNLIGLDGKPCSGLDWIKFFVAVGA